MKTAILVPPLALAIALAAALSAPCAEPRTPESSRSTADAQTVLNTVSEMQHIDSASFATRGALADEISRRIAASEKVLNVMQTRAKSLDSAERQRFNAYLAEAKKREATLKRSVEDVRKAKPDTWEHAQIMLADNYEFYDDTIELLNVVAPALPK